MTELTNPRPTESGRTKLQLAVKELYDALDEADTCAMEVSRTEGGTNIGRGAEYLIALLKKDLRLSLHSEDIL